MCDKCDAAKTGISTIVNAAMERHAAEIQADPNSLLYGSDFHDNEDGTITLTMQVGAFELMMRTFLVGAEAMGATVNPFEYLNQEG